VANVANDELERIRAFDDRFARVQATDVVELPWGYAVLQRDFPLSRYHNRVVVTGETSAREMLEAADRILAAFAHRYVSVDDDALGEAVRADFATAGYAHETIATMLHSGAPVPAPAHDVRTVSLDEARPAIIRDWRAALPEATDEQLAQLADRQALGARAAEQVLLAVYEDGEIAAHAELTVDRSARVAQFEGLVTDTERRGHGYGRSLVFDALRRSRAAGCDVAFLTADLADWPLEWYRRLGYVEVARVHHFSRSWPVA
jgi:GNAT superfamily N-acetyltransferase